MYTLIESRTVRACLSIAMPTSSHVCSVSCGQSQAQRILDYGLSKHGSFIREPDYILAYMDMLLLKGDESNLKVLLERVLAPTGLSANAAAAPVWDKILELELWRNTVSLCSYVRDEPSTPRPSSGKDVAVKSPELFYETSARTAALYGLLHVAFTGRRQPHQS